MTLIPIDDPDDPRVAAFRFNERGLTNRVQRRSDAGDGLFMAEGDLVVERALAAGCVPVSALVDSRRPPAITEQLLHRIDVFAGGELMRTAITKMGTPYSVVALFQRPARVTVDEIAARTDRIILVEAVDNPLNMGSIARNGLGLGWSGLVIDSTSADPLARRALRVSMGQTLHLPHARVGDMSETIKTLRAADWLVCALTPDVAAVPLEDVAPDGRIALLVGAERVGLTPAVMEAASIRARIEMYDGVDSLNVAAATAVACWQLRRR
ncbi:MAG: RNA methyltransferase [Actinobacteria bacterium]|nr:RNA methyltransferase [Actinomycetota bacterium]